MRTIPIYPDSWASMNTDRAGQKYQPSNGTEGECFHSAWCCECARDLSMSEGMPIEECDDNQKCDILGRSFLPIDHPDYPIEWQYGKDGQPCCTAYVEKGKPIPPLRDDQTLDLFGTTAGDSKEGASDE